MKFTTIGKIIKKLEYYLQISTEDSPIILDLAGDVLTIKSNRAGETKDIDPAFYPQYMVHSRDSKTLQIVVEWYRRQVGKV